LTILPPHGAYFSQREQVLGIGVMGWSSTNLVRFDFLDFGFVGFVLAIFVSPMQH